jgi:hypothetical protein
MTRHSKQTAAFLVLGGEVAAGIDPTLVLLETANGQLDLLRTDGELGDNWYVFCCADGITRVLTLRDLEAPSNSRATRQHPRPARQHPRPLLRRVGTPTIRAQRTVRALHGTP